MQIRVLAMAALAAGILSGSTATARAQSDPMAGGLGAGDYLRVFGGVASPVSPKGSLRNWGNGTNVGVAYENWSAGGNGGGDVSIIGFGLMAGYSFLPLKEDQFRSTFVPSGGGTVQSVSASNAGILEVASQFRVRIPAPVVMPSILVGFGFINWAPAAIHYTATSGSGEVKQTHRSGAEVSIGAALDRQLWGRYALYAEGQYVYGYTSYGQGFATPGGVCASNGCDVLSNTTFATLRGGLRIRMGRE